ncbi:MAG: F0F1 ATP synthase subunit A [Bacteroidetes bacterium]|nr:F0F1 ATP synthase subunit A [Bacteroidota bacterium]
MVILKPVRVIKVLLLIASLTSPFALLAEHGHEAESQENHTEEEFNATDVIMHHISDAHEFHIVGNLAVYLPVILWTDNGLDIFSSEHLYHNPVHIHGHEKEHAYQYQTDKGSYILFHEKIYYADSHGTLTFKDDSLVNLKPMDFSITKNVFSMFLSVLFLILIFIPTAAHYKKNKGAPKGIAAWMEPIIIFVRDDIAKPNIGHKYAKYMPYLLTIFFFIWVNNLIGLVPFFPFSANLSGNIGFTLTMAAITLIVILISSNGNYWKHIFATPGVPVWLLPIMIPVELMGVIAKPFALMIRLFANITAGHIVVLSLVSLIFIFKNVGMAGVSVPFTLFISVLELLVAALQAYIFTMLSALFIGQAIEEHH